MSVWRLQEIEHYEYQIVDEKLFSSRPSPEDVRDFMTCDYREFSQIEALYNEGHLPFVNGVKYTLTEVKVHGPVEDEGTWEDFAYYIGQITYKPGWYFRTGREDGRMWVQVGVTEEAEISFDPIEGKKVPWRGAKHFLSQHMCRNEIVGTVLHAIERAEMHEVHEWFRYKGRSIHNPHLDPDALAVLAGRLDNFNTRENAMTMEEPS